MEALPTEDGESADSETKHNRSSSLHSSENEESTQTKDQDEDHLRYGLNFSNKVNEDIRESCSEVHEIMIPDVQTRLALSAAIDIEPELDSLSLKPSKSLTFEDYFRKPSVQREFVANVLTFQTWMNLSSFLVSSLCAFLTDQLWFWEAKDDLLNVLLLHTVILSTLLVIYPLISYKLRRTKQSPGMLAKVILDTLLRVYQAAVLTFWVALLLGKIWRGHVQIEGETSGSKVQDLESRPIFFLLTLYYGLNLVNHFGVILCLRHTQMDITNLNASFLSFAFCGLSLLGVFLVILIIGRAGFLSWDIGQVMAAALLTAINGSFILCSFRKGYESNSSRVSLSKEMDPESLMDH